MNQSVADAKPRDEWLEFWERRETPVLEAMPYVLLVFATSLDIAVRGGLGAETRIDLALALASAAWMAWMVSLHREWIERTHLMQVFFAGLVGLMAAMVVRAPIFGFYTFTGYVWAVLVLRGRQRLLGVAAVATISAISQSGGAPAITASALGLFAVIWLINFGFAGGVMWFGWVGNEQKRRRERAIAELTEANRRLEETLRENAALHEQLLVQAREAGVAEERQRLAGEIHDTLAQGHTGIITQLQAAE
jgi:signal transduction histidine kinase